MEEGNDQSSRGGEHSDTDEEDDGVLLLHHKLLQSLQSPSTPKEQTSLITQLRTDPQLMSAVMSHRRHQRQRRVRDESNQTDDLDNLEGSSPSLRIKEYSSQEELQQITSITFSNPVILDKIFSYLPTPKSLRLVCKKWSDIFLSGKARLLFNLCSIQCTNFKQFETLVDVMNPKLVKILNVNDSTRCTKDIPISFKLLHMCRKWGFNMQEIRITCEAEIIPTFCTILREHCPNIKHLWILINSVKSELKPPIQSNLTVLPKLQSLFCQIFPPAKRDTKKVEVWSQLFRTFLQDLITASPRLEKLEINSFFYPNLRMKKELRSLKLYVTCDCNIHKTVNDEYDVRIEEMSSVLKQVKDSLESLELVNVSHTCDKSCDFASIEIPTMAKLKTFTNGSVATFKLQGKLRQSWIEMMPCLETLKISNSTTTVEFKELDIMEEIEHILRPQFEGTKKLGVKTLILVGITDAIILKELKQSFPCLKKLQVVLFPKEGYRNAIAKAIEACSHLELRHISISMKIIPGIGFGYKISPLVKTLWEYRNSMFSGGRLRTLEIINDPSHDTYFLDDLEESEEQWFQEILLLTRQMESVVFEGFMLRGGHAGRIFNCIRDNTLPVHFRK